MHRKMLLHAAAGLLAAGFVVSPRDSVRADTLPVTDVVTLTNYFANAYSEIQGTSNANVRVCSIEEAVASVDNVFAKAKAEGLSENGLARMKRLLKDSLAFVCSYDATVVEEPIVYPAKHLDLPVGETFSVFAFYERLFESHINTGYILSDKASIYPRNCSGLVAWVSKKDGKVFYLDSVFACEIMPLPFPLRRLEADVSTGVWEKVTRYTFGGDGEPVEKTESELRPRTDCEVELIADIEDVSFNSLESLNHTHVIGYENGGYSPAHAVATYRVELIVRKVNEGAFDYDRITFVVDPRKHQNLLCGHSSRWPFFRGMTLQVLLCREGDSLKVARVHPVLPYPPYDDNVEIDNERVSSRFALNPEAAKRPTNAVATAFVKYGNHTLVKFYTTTNDITGIFGPFPDYSRTLRVEVWTASEGADADYWRTAWFTKPWRDDDESDGANPVVTIRNVEEGMDDETRLAFAWGSGFQWSEESLNQVTNLGEFVNVMNRRTTCRTCGKPHYRIVLPEELRTRTIKLDEDAYGRELALLKDVCERTGCVYTLKGSDIVLSSELSEAELSDKSLAGRLHVLEKDGFATVAGAEYAKFSFFDRGFGSEKPHEVPAVFSYRSSYVMTGDGWRRRSADGKDQYLLFDAVWWTGDADSRNSRFYVKTTRTRLARDVAKVRAYLRDAAEDPKDFDCRYEADKNDLFALTFALHLHQFGRPEDAQSLYELLSRRPDALEAAFAKLRQRVKLGRQKYPTLEAWEKAENAGKGK